MHIKVFLDQLDQTKWPKPVNHEDVGTMLNAIYDLTQIGWPLALAAKFVITPVEWTEVTKEQTRKALESIRDTGDFEWEAVK